MNDWAFVLILLEAENLLYLELDEKFKFKMSFNVLNI